VNALKWPTFIVLVLVTLILQVTLAPRLAPFDVRPEWVLVLVVFYALHGPPQHAFAVGWVAGALCDLMTIGPFGLISASFGVTTWLVGRVRGMVFQRHPLTHFAVTLCAAMLVQTLWWIYRGLVDIKWGWEASVVLSCLYTACWAPPLQWALMHFPGLLGFRIPGRPRVQLAGI
jgi:rod shape-determining protein MreD